MFFVERFIIRCPYFGGSTIGGYTVYNVIILAAIMKFADLMITQPPPTIDSIIKGEKNHTTLA